MHCQQQCLRAYQITLFCDIWRCGRVYDCALGVFNPDNHAFPRAEPPVLGRAADKYMVHLGGHHGNHLLAVPHNGRFFLSVFQKRIGDYIFEIRILFVIVEETALELSRYILTNSSISHAEKRRTLRRGKHSSL
jgi:hypothetical protein